MPALIERMQLYGWARNRGTDPEPRTVTITDDEAIVIAGALTHLVSDVTVYVDNNVFHTELRE